MSARVLVVGLDGLPPEIAFGKPKWDLPNLRALARDGAFGPLRTTHPPITVPAWSVMMTSRNPGHLGFTGFRNLRRGTYDGEWTPDSRSVPAPRVWDTLGAHGKRVMIQGVPQTHPPPVVNGCLTSCFLTPSPVHPWTHPPHLAHELREHLGCDYVHDVPGFRRKDRAELFADLTHMTDLHFRASRHLVKRERWDFMMSVEIGTDRLHHGFWGEEELMRHYYERLDERIGRLVEAAGRDCAVLVVSDHGARAMEGAVNVNDLLRAEGLLRFAREPEGVQPFRPADVDWARTTAWCMGGYYARVYVNLKGREPQGYVEKRNYAQTREDVAHLLRRVRARDGRSMRNIVLKPEEVYSGPHVTDAPDLLAYFGDLAYRAHQSVGHAALHSDVAEVGPDASTHDWDGVFILHDPAQRLRGRVDGLEIRDVAPTLLELAGVKPPETYEGRSVWEVARRA